MAKELDGTIESLKEANKLFNDLSTSLSRSMRLNIDFKNIDEGSKAIENLIKNTDNVAKVNKQLADNWKSLGNAQKQINDEINKNNESNKRRFAYWKYHG